MDVTKDQSSIIILKSLECLSRQVDLSNKDDLEKEAAKLLIEKIKLFYCKKVEGLDIDNIDRIYNIQGFMTEIIANINASLCVGADIFYYIESINNNLKDKDINNLINKHKVLKCIRNIN